MSHTDIDRIISLLVFILLRMCVLFEGELKIPTNSWNKSKISKGMHGWEHEPWREFHFDRSIKKLLCRSWNSRTPANDSTHKFIWIEWFRIDLLNILATVTNLSITHSKYYAWRMQKIKKTTGDLFGLFGLFHHIPF